MAEPSETVMEIREEIMVSAKGGKPTSQISHFIKPMLQIFDLPPKFPPISLPFHPIFPKCDFNCWPNPNQHWLTWVNRMHSKHKFTWKKSGIYEAVLSSKYNIVRNDELLFALSERWCLETNTFVFPWGEAGVTLEDVMVLGGFSVLGASVCRVCNDDEVARVEAKLVRVYESLRDGVEAGVDQVAWMKRFLGRNSDVEHEAFLVFWLSRFVFPSYPFGSIVAKCFGIAVCLSRGVEIALAPVVLAGIYRDLSLLKSCVVNVDNEISVFGDDVLMLTLWGPLHWVQVWAWERFPELRPNPKEIEFGEPWVARWDRVDLREVGNLRPMLQSAGDSFVWRPYCKDVDNLPSLALFGDEEKWVYLDGSVGKDVEFMAHCLRVTELVGLDSLEQYNPHRVAMQFGFDQDLPCVVKSCLLNSGVPHKELEQLAWLNYAQPIKDRLLYIPSRLYSPKVTLRYLKWLRDGILTPAAALGDSLVKRKRDSIRFKRFQPPRLLFEDKIFDDRDIPPGLETICTTPLKFGNIGKHGCLLESLVDVPDVPPGFIPICTTPLKSSSIGKHGCVLESQVDVPDVPPGYVPICTTPLKSGKVGKHGRVLESLVDNPNVPPGFEPVCTTPVKSGNTGKPRRVLESLVDVPDVPPGFKPICTTPLKSGNIGIHGRVLESVIKVKEERIDSICGDDQALLNLPGENSPTKKKKKKSTNVAEDCPGKSNRADDAENEPTCKGIAEAVSRNRGLLDVKARLTQLEKLLSGLKEAK